MKKFFLILISIFILKADVIPNVCGYFASALSARGNCANKEGNITFDGEIIIDNNGSQYLSSCNVIIPDWVKQKVQTCKIGQCKSTHHPAKSLNINYNNPPSLVSLDNTPSSSDENVTVNSDITLNKENYNKIEFNKKNKQVTFHKSYAILSYDLKINTIEKMWKVVFEDKLNNLEIGTINGATYSPPIILKNENDINHIKIKNLNLASGNEVNLSATNSIEMENFSVGRGNSVVVLKSPSITINNLNLTNNGSGNVDVYLYSDNINIGSLSMGQNSKLYILPYDDNNVTFKSNSISASSSSTIYLSSGNYYTSSLNIPGSSNNSPIKALDSNQVVNLFINNSFTPGNNPGINSNGDRGDYGDLPPYNFRVFINGNLNTGGGGTTFNAIVYVEGNATLGSPTYIKGALSAENIVTKNNSEVIYDKPDDNEAFEFCPIDESNASFCYNNPIVLSGISCCGFSALEEVITPIKNFSNNDFQDVKIIKAFNGINISALQKIKLDNVEKTPQKDGDGAHIENNLSVLFGNWAIIGAGFNKGIVYKINNFNAHSEHNISDYSTFSFDMSKVKYIVLYKKDGLVYRGLLQNCSNYLNVGIIGSFDAKDTFRSSEDRNISTKIVNKEFNLTLMSLNSQNKYLKIGDINVSIFDIPSGNRISNIVFFDTNFSKEVNKTFTVTKASQNARVGFLICSDYNATTKKHTLYNYDRCNDTSIVSCNTSGLHLRRCYSSDNFAIRPYSFLIFGNNQYKRAGEDFNISIKAVDNNNFNKNSGNINDVSGVLGYNENINDLNISAVFYTPNENETRQMNVDVYDINDTNVSRVAYCPNRGVFTIISGNNFINGEINTTMKYSESGILTLRVAEKNGSEFAKVDEKDTNDSQRFIKPANFIINENNLSQRNLLLEFIPYKFVTDGDYNSTTGSFVYMNDINNSIIPQMAAFLTYKIIAENKDGEKLLNYTKTCFPDTSDSAPKRNGLKLNTTFDLFLDSNVNVSDESNLSFSIIDSNNNSHIWLLHPELNLRAGTHSIQEWVSPLDFDLGEANVKLFLNIKRDYRHPKNEINITVNDINTSTSWMSNPGATKVFVGKTLNKSINFRYGRIDVEDVIGYGNELNTTVKYEYWNDENGWIVNKEHNNANFGNIDLSNSYYNDAQSVKKVNESDSNINLTLFSINNGEENITISTNHSLPYSVKIHYSIPNYLWYHPLAKPYKNPSSTNLDCLTHPCSDVEFKSNKKGWGGAGINTPKYQESNRTVEINASNVNIKSNKKSVTKINW